MEAAVVISALSLVVAIGTFLWNRHIWRAARRTRLRVVAVHDGGGLDLYESGAVETEHVIEVQVFNHGERSEYVRTIGLETPYGDPLADNRPSARKLVDEPAAESKEVPPRGHRAVRFKLPASTVKDGFVGYAVLATGEQIYSVPAKLDADIPALQAEILKAVAEAERRRSTS